MGRMRAYRFLCAHRPICPSPSSSIGSSASFLHSAEIEGEIFRDSELAAQIVDLFGVERADDVDDHDLLRVGDQHADSFDHGVVVDHQEDLDVFAVALAAHADDAIPAGRGELLANRFDIGLAVFALFVELHAFDVNALERLDDLFDRGLIRLSLLRNLDAMSSSAPSILTSIVSTALGKSLSRWSICKRAFCAYTGAAAQTSASSAIETSLSIIGFISFPP